VESGLLVCANANDDAPINTFSLFTKLQLTQRMSNMAKADAGKVAATQNLLQGLRQARTKAPGAACPDGDYDPAPVSPSDTFYEQLLDEVEKRLVALLPAAPDATNATAPLARQQSASRPPTAGPSQSSQGSSSSQQPADTIPQRPQQMPQQQQQPQQEAGWKEAAGRRHGSEGYQFGDFSRSLFRKLG
jgi:hypothetical protein